MVGRGQDALMLSLVTRCVQLLESLFPGSSFDLEVAE
jgi:hypothetical protein